MQKVVHINRDPYDTYIGRGSIWGNPFKIGRDGTRKEVLQKYKDYLIRGEGRHLLEHIGELEGKTLGCFCAEAGGLTTLEETVCHGQLLLQLLQRRSACGYGAVTASGLPAPAATTARPTTQSGGTQGMSVTRATTNVIVIEADEDEIKDRHRADRQTLRLLDLQHFDHHLAQAEAVFSNLARDPHNLARMRAMRDRTASSLEAMESRLGALE